jgi:hypothetical protein
VARALENEFAQLTAEEIARIEELYRASFGERAASKKRRAAA